MDGMWHLMCLIIGILKHLGQALLKWVEREDIIHCNRQWIGMLGNACCFILLREQCNFFATFPRPMICISRFLLVLHGIRMDVLDLYCRIRPDVYWPQTASGRGYVHRRERIQHRECACLLMQAMNITFLYAWHVGDSVQITLPTEILSHEMNTLKDFVFSDFNTWRKQITQ